MRNVLASVLFLFAGCLCRAEAPSLSPKAPLSDWEAEVAADKAARESLLAKLPGLKPARFYYLNPSAFRDGSPRKGELFHNWSVVSEGAPNDQASEDMLIKSLREILTHAYDGIAACFDPHHGVVLSDGVHTYDVVICFECWRYYVYASDGKLLLGASFEVLGQEKKWDAAFNASGLSRLPPKPRPGA